MELGGIQYSFEKEALVDRFTTLNCELDIKTWLKT